MNKDEFIRACSLGGYCNKGTAVAWCEKHQKEEYSAEDFVAVYRFATEPRMGERRYGWREMGDGNRNTINHVHRGLAGNNRWDQDC